MPPGRQTCAHGACIFQSDGRERYRLLGPSQVAGRHPLASSFANVSRFAGWNPPPQTDANPMRKSASDFLKSRPFLGVVVLVIVVLGGLFAQRRVGSGRWSPAGHGLATANPSSRSDEAPQARRSASKPANTKRPQKGRTGSPASGKTPSKARPLGALRRLPGDIYESTAGLRYGPGSREGHRLKHVLRHTADQPSRPGSHGVFVGGRAGALATIDEAYLIALKRDSRVRVQSEGKRTVYTVDLGREIGYVGGQEGKRRSQPRVSHVRLVLEGEYVITAFPVTP